MHYTKKRLILQHLIIYLQKFDILIDDKTKNMCYTVKVIMNADFIFGSKGD